ncbi:MAG: cupin domain-containing protein [Dethiobacter sp.]|jgi:gentisate 1,2-dioxygenase|nr:cupin domain-containing protein [Dethiobacter sp.]
MKTLILKPFKDAEEIWLGLEEPEKKMVRKVFRLVTKDLVNSTHFCAGLTIFEPGEASSMHNHPGSEEIDFIVKGSGILVADGEERPFEEHDFMFVPDGLFHQHKNTGNEPLWLIWIYSPQGELPKN